ncbi:hypothetical protein Vi05172_g7282 [Venturia inaequalis]|nr:hypothetical protein Vi05172_g7282 [Venturia inaequalis]
MPAKPEDATDSPPSSPPAPLSPPSKSRGSSRHGSSASQGSIGRREPHAPLNPSSLRRSVVASTSPETTFTRHGNAQGKRPSMADSGKGETGTRPTSAEEAATAMDESEQLAEPPQWRGNELSAKTRLLGDEQWVAASGYGYENYSPRPVSTRQGSYMSYRSFDAAQKGFGVTYGGGDMDGEDVDPTQSLLGDAIADGVMEGGHGSKMSSTEWLARKHGVRSRRMMYVSYYVPFLNWIRQYRWAYLQGDVIAALTMASFYIPMSLSYASNLGHIPPVNGLYSFVFNPITYAILGTCPQMVVGPEAAGSLLTGQVVKDHIKAGHGSDEDGVQNAETAGLVTFMAGSIILLAGIFRLGFLDNVLSRPFLRGFISAIGIVIFVDQLIPEMGLTALARDAQGVDHGSSVEKIMFLIKNFRLAHGLTTAVSFSSFTIIMICRELKHRLQPRYPSAAYVPDRFLVVVLSAILTWKFGWDKKGLAILGDIQSQGRPFPARFPLQPSQLAYASDAFSTSFVIALLGFFESSVAAKSLGVGEATKGKVFKNLNLSPNRELVALGVANIIGGVFMALPAFGGYGRSKVNASTGGRTPVSSILLSLITIVCVLFMMPYFYYLPKAVLSAMISVVGYSLLEEIPPDLMFFVRIRGYSELLLMTLIFLATIFWNLKIGIAVGIGLSLLRVLRHSTRPRIHILGRVPGTTDKFENAETAKRIEFVEGVLIIKIPEPLTFANTGDLKGRLRRLEDHGTGQAHPALPPVRERENNKNVVFDVHGVTSLDGAGAQILMEIVKSYRESGVRVFFCRVPGKKSNVWRLFEQSGIVELCNGSGHFVGSVEEALRLTELEDVEEMLGREYDAAQAA